MNPIEGALYSKILEDGTQMAVYAMLFNDRICIGPEGAFYYDRGWCVPQGRGVEIAQDWDGQGDPPDFIKEVGTQRYGPGATP